MTTTYEIHPLAEIFPEMTDAELDELGEDIKKHGLREPITLFEGKVLDGRNRYLACQRRNIEPTTTVFTGDNPLAFVISKNLHRRQLSESQRAMVAKEIATLEHGQRQSGKFAGVPTQAEAASRLSVSERSVRTAGVVLDKAVPEVITAVKQGEVKVSAAAEFAKLDKAEQSRQITKAGGTEPAIKALAAKKKAKAKKKGGPLSKAALAVLDRAGANVAKAEAPKPAPDSAWAVIDRDSRQLMEALEQIERMVLPIGVEPAVNGLSGSDLAVAKRQVEFIGKWCSHVLAALADKAATK